ncbi:beta-ketoacyl-ACP synthase III [Thiorhodococcus mannitoliphagus]|uniref:Beta-ketoacyl-ACP synthase III n=1 Tax=Thiorhodococcus mannitoliphagus TaxID=329406 RepID=A0A6P1DUS3_9GAMM|nr:beta-ketoacyl-ACP synthase III [Thiorhodococcus mannitoliphagus]
MDAYITNLASFLPGHPVANEDIELYLGPVDRVSSRTRTKILAGNGIQTRHYAIDRENGEPTHTNAQLTAEAIRRLNTSGNGWSCLVCGTSSPDQLMPGHASMVHGELGQSPCEVVSTAGICLSGVMALKYAAMAVATGSAAGAVATGSELASSYMRTDFFAQAGCRRLGNNASEPSHPAFSFEEQFLRWMLSDGAGAVLIEPESRGPLSLRIDWIELTSQAHRLATCMYAGCSKQNGGEIVGWREALRQGESGGVFTIKQDAKLLNREVLPALVGNCLPSIVSKHKLTATEVDWFLPHYSSAYFREPLERQLSDIGFAIPQERWFTNLSTKGNTGAASFYIMLEELVLSGRLRPGDRILGFVPESGRFAVGYLLLTVV